jgi:riboflavin kinase/FMN adenylyltransferase
MNKIVAIGNFDGVHRGHQAILATARAEAGTGQVVAVTFWPHPAAVLRPDRPPALLGDILDRVALLRQAGADEVSIVEFTTAVGAWSPSQFVERVIWPLGPTGVVVGQNFRFGSGAGGDGYALRDLAQGRFGVTVLPMLGDDASGGPVSSSRIRAAVAVGDAKQAAQLLGRWFRYSGVVMLGDQRGRTLGFPTANLAVAPGFACMADGVYAGWLTSRDQCWPTAISVGTNPTFAGAARRVEAYVLDRTDLKLYGERIGIDFVARLRGQHRFESRQALIEQMNADVAATRAITAAGPGPGPPPG